MFIKPSADVAGFAFFSVMRKYMRTEIHDFLSDGLTRMLGITSAIAFSVLTLWVMIKGYQIMTGQSKEPLMGFVTQAGKAVLIVAIATSVDYYKPWIQDNIENFRDAITYTITGSDKDVYKQVDKNIAIAQGIMVTINTIAENQGPEKTSSEARAASWLGMLGGATPAVVAGMVSLLNEFMLSLAIVLGPLFMLGLLFEQTKQLFWNWVRYIIGIMFSMAVLAFMSGIVMKISIGYASAVAAAILANWTGLLGGGIDGPNIMKTCMMQGGLGMVLSLLLITIPPMVMQFFSVSLGGGVSGYSPFSGKAPEGTGAGEAQKAGTAPTGGKETNNGDTGAGRDLGLATGQAPKYSYDSLSSGDRGAAKGELVQSSGGGYFIGTGNAASDWAANNRANNAFNDGVHDAQVLARRQALSEANSAAIQARVSSK